MPQRKRVLPHTGAQTVIRSFLELTAPFATILDIGAGEGRDLGIAEEIAPGAHRVAIELADRVELVRHAHKIYPVDIERRPLPIDSASLDVVMANQVLEHTKEIFWIFHEVTRVLKVGGHLIIGVPNLLSLHNRLLMLLGHHPTHHELHGGQVRVFSMRDMASFLDGGFPGGYETRAFAGSQVYPFPGVLSRPLARALPSMATSIFWLLKKTRPYSASFLRRPAVHP